MKRLALAFVALTTWLSLFPASAQSFAPGTFSVGPYPVACGPVWTVVTPGVGDIARVLPAMGGLPPRILIDPSFYGLPVPVQLFVYAHECGHHVVGLNENAADCWAAKLGRQQGWFTRVTMDFLTMTFQWNPGDWTHAPGPVRLQNIAACWKSP